MQIGFPTKQNTFMLSDLRAAKILGFTVSKIDKMLIETDA